MKSNKIVSATQRVFSLTGRKKNITVIKAFNNRVGHAAAGIIDHITCLLDQPVRCSRISLVGMVRRSDAHSREQSQAQHQSDHTLAERLQRAVMHIPPQGEHYSDHNGDGKNIPVGQTAPDRARELVRHFAERFHNTGGGTLALGFEPCCGAPQIVADIQEDAFDVGRYGLEPRCRIEQAWIIHTACQSANIIRPSLYRQPWQTVGIIGFLSKSQNIAAHVENLS